MRKIVIAILVTFVCSNVSWAQKAVVWEEPTTAFYRLSGMLNVSKVELQKDLTSITFHVNMPGRSQIGFSSETMLQAEGKDYKIKSINDYKVNEGINLPASGNIDLVIMFEPLPTSTKSFSFTMPGAFSIDNIHDNNQTREDINDTYWRNDKTGDWVLGIVDDKVIYDCKPWNITSKKESKGTYNLEVTDGSTSLPIYINKVKAGKRSITIGKEKAECSMITSNFLPDYPTADTNPVIADNNYRKGDSITIIGWMKGMTQDLRNISGEFDAAYESIFTEKGLTFPAKLDSSGFFTLRMPIENTQMLYCDWQRSNIVFVAEPGETYFLLKDFSENKTLVMGKNSRLQNELLANPTHSNYPNYQRVKEMGGAIPYLHISDSLNNVALDRLNELCKSHPTLSARYKNYCRNKILSETASGLMQARFSVPNHELPKEYVDFVTENYWNKIEEPFTMLGNQYTSFFRDYSGSLLDRLSKSSENLWKYALLKADKDGNIKLSEEDKTFIDEYADGIKAIDKRIAEAPDSLKPQIAKEFNEGPLVKGLNEIIARKGVNEAIETILNLRDYNLMINAADSLGWSQIQKDIMLSTKIYQFIDNIRQPLKPFLLKFADDNIHQDAAIEAIHELNDKYLTLANKQISTNNLKSSDDVKGLSEGEQILNKILEPYKGKIVLLDIWGTWCGPCKQALSHSQEEYEHLKDYPMVYLYLANRSNDESWKNVIKEYNVTGENVVHYNLPTPQQRAVENFLNVRSFPTYKLFNKEGKLLDVNADPRNINALEGLIKQINK